MAGAIHCTGCGAIIRTENPHELGYTSKTTFEKGMETGEVYCQRCFRLRHCNDIQDIQLTDDDLLRLLSGLGIEDALIVDVVDISDFNDPLILGLCRFIGNNLVLLAGDKMDILPKSLKKLKMVQRVREQAHEAGLHPVDVSLTNGKKPQETRELLNTIEKYREDRDIYAVGATNVGKSTLINQIIQQIVGVQDVITTSQFPETTLDKIEIPLDDGHLLIDTPGIIHRHQMAHYLGRKGLRVITPQEEIKSKVHQLNTEQILLLGGLARSDYVQGAKSSFIAYVSNDLSLRQTRIITADAFHEKHVGGSLQPPRTDEVAESPELARFEFFTRERVDIVFAGLGQITITEPSIVAGWVPKSADVLRRKALI